VGRKSTAIKKATRRKFPKITRGKSTGGIHLKKKNIIYRSLVETFGQGVRNDTER